MSHRYDDGAVMPNNFWVQPADETARRLATASDAAIIKGMCLRGDPQSRIAAYFDTNPGRINEVKKGRRFGEVQPAPVNLLPASGPHIAPQIQITGIAEEFRRSQQRMEEKLDHVLRQLAGFGRRIGLIEEPRTPRIGRRKPLEA